MLKNSKGVTLTALVITVMVLLILASITVNSGKSTVDDAKYYKGIADMKTMQSKVNELYEEYKNGDTSLLNNGDSLTSNAKTLKAYNSTKKTDANIGDITDFKYYSAQYIKDTLGLQGIDSDFMVNIKTRTVILVDGISRNGETVYSLCQIEGEQYNVHYEEN